MIHAECSVRGCFMPRKKAQERELFKSNLANSIPSFAKVEGKLDVKKSVWKPTMYA